MHYFEDPGQMTAEQRFDEIASILAAGLLRLQQRPATLPKSGRVCQDSPESGTSGLELPAQKGLSVRAG